MQNLLDKKNITILDLAGYKPHLIYKQIEDAAKVIEVSVYRLCKLSGVEYTTVNKWSRDETEPSLRIVSKLLETIKTMSLNNTLC